MGVFPLKYRNEIASFLYTVSYRFENMFQMYPLLLSLRVRCTTIIWPELLKLIIDVGSPRFYHIISSILKQSEQSLYCKREKKRYIIFHEYRSPEAI